MMQDVWYTEKRKKSNCLSDKTVNIYMNYIVYLFDYYAFQNWLE